MALSTKKLKELRRVPVKSSNIASVGHDEETNTLVVMFHGGKLYAYQPVTKEAFGQLWTAPSVGKYFYEKIKNNPDITVTKVS